MYKRTATLTRPDTSQPYWYSSSNFPAEYGTIGYNHLQLGWVIMQYSDLETEDQLTLVRTSYFADETAYNNAYNDLISNFPSIITDRDNYNTIHGHTFNLSFESIL